MIIQTQSTAQLPERTLLYEDEPELWYREDDRFWIEEKGTAGRTEIIPGNAPEDAPLPQQWFVDYGTLLGNILARRRT